VEILRRAGSMAVRAPRHQEDELSEGSSEL
jgi:hypothetical protein